MNMTHTGYIKCYFKDDKLLSIGRGRDPLLGRMAVLRTVRKSGALLQTE